MDNSSSQDAQQLEDGDQVEPQYEGEDTRLTSQKELSGWYSYGFAAEVFAICAMGKCPRQVSGCFHHGFCMRCPRTSQIYTVWRCTGEPPY